MLPFILSLSCVVVASGCCVWFLVKDRNFWRNEYRTLSQEARERERHLFDQLLKVRGFRTTTEPLTSQPHGVVRAPALDAEDLEIIDSRINERVEAGIMTPSEGWMLASDVRAGRKTTADVDRVLWQRQKNEFPGSVADID